MKLENQVCAREWSKKLGKLGVKQESLWYWVHFKSVTGYKQIVLWKKDRALGNQPKGFGEKIGIYSAFTCAELGEIISDKTSWWEDKGIYIFNDCSTWFVQMRKWGYGEIIHDVNRELLANALAKMLVYLLENKLIDMEK